MRAVWVLVPMFLVVAVTAAVPPGEYQDVEQSTCWECHAPGLWNPEMVEPRVSEYRFDPTPDGWVLSATVDNPWLHDLQRVAGLVHMPNGLAHFGGNATIETHHGSMQSMPGTSMVAMEMIEVPEGTQRLAIRAQTEGMLPHDMEMRVYPGNATEPWGDVRQNGSHQEARFGSESLAAAGWGHWTVALHLEGDLSMLDAVEYTIEVESDLDPGKQPWLAISEENVAPYGEVTLTWPLSVVGDQPQQPAALYLLTDMYYDHEDDANPDLAQVTTPLQFPVQVRDGTPSFVDEERDDEDQAVPGVPAVALLVALVGSAAIIRRR